MQESMDIRPIGIIHTPYRRQDEIPIQGRFKPDVEAWLELDERYAPGLKDLEGFSHAILLYVFHLARSVKLLGRPFLEDIEHGIFSIRGPNRPNHIGLSIVSLKRVEERRVYFTRVDMLDETPLLDIKPYVSHFDGVPDARNGWIDKHFEKGIPERAKKKVKNSESPSKS